MLLRSSATLSPGIHENTGVYITEDNIQFTLLTAIPSLVTAYRTLPRQSSTPCEEPLAQNIRKRLETLDQEWVERHEGGT
jgi:hypothetical protein